MRLDDFDYTLPPNLIAQEPAPQRELSRLLVLHRVSGAISHDHFSHLRAYLRDGDVLVVNRSKVIPARVEARKETGGSVELLLLRSEAPERWVALARPSRRLRAGMRLSVCRSRLSANLEANLGEGEWLIHFTGEGDVGAELRAAGALPLPPYIRNERAPLDRYQTVYADRDGSIAAPTAGLHFSRPLLNQLRMQGIDVEMVTLHVGPGTFKPVTAERVEQHRIHGEWAELSAEVAARLSQARAQGRRIIAVGTTTTRLLESAVEDGEIRPFQGVTDRFIYPGYRFQAIDGLVTNFHLPRSTLLMLVSAFAGRELILSTYTEAIRRGYRFYSFGDAMLIV